jgi:hypothetical protein
MSYWIAPKKRAGKWWVTWVGYPESRSLEEYDFSTEKRAQDFYDKNTDSKVGAAK